MDDRSNRSPCGTRSGAAAHERREPRRGAGRGALRPGAAARAPDRSRGEGGTPAEDEAPAPRDAKKRVRDERRDAVGGVELGRDPALGWHRGDVDLEGRYPQRRRCVPLPAVGAEREGLAAVVGQARRPGAPGALQAGLRIAARRRRFWCTESPSPDTFPKTEAATVSGIDPAVVLHVEVVLRGREYWAIWGGRRTGVAASL